MPVLTPQGASLGQVDQIIANSRGEVQKVVVSQGRVTRTLPASMFTASSDALIAGSAQGDAFGQNGTGPEPDLNAAPNEEAN